MKKILLALSFLIASCGGSKDDSRSDLDNEIQFAQANTSCRDLTTCALIETGCNIRCSIAVSKSDNDRIQALVEDYKREEGIVSENCDNSCVPKKLACMSHDCVVVDL